MKHLFPVTLVALVAMSCTKDKAEKEPGYFIETAYIAISANDIGTMYDNTNLINMQWETRPDKPTGVYITAYDYSRRDLHVFFKTPTDTLAATTYPVERFSYELDELTTAHEKSIEIKIDSIKRNRVFGSITGTATDYNGKQLTVEGTITNIFLEDHE
jgi:hypothetical protein